MQETLACWLEQQMRHAYYLRGSEVGRHSFVGAIELPWLETALFVVGAQPPAALDDWLDRSIRETHAELDWAYLSRDAENAHRQDVILKLLQRIRARVESGE